MLCGYSSIQHHSSKSQTPLSRILGTPMLVSSNHDDGKIFSLSRTKQAAYAASTAQEEEEKPSV
tara:strand:+ start:454 stop:645 length:192 start_codon:yes stop_codon:yes gene_type:complete